MSEDSEREPAVRLERPVRIQRRSWLRRLLHLLIVCVSVAIVTGRSDVGLIASGRECAAAVHGQRLDAVAVCQRAYQDNQDPAMGVLLAKAQYDAGDKAAAGQLASELASTPQRSDALQMLGRVARGNNRSDDAAAAYEEARRLHRIERRWDELSFDAGLLATIRTERDEFAEALRLADECLSNAALAKSQGRQRYCHLVAAAALIRAGFWKAANDELDSADALSKTDMDRSHLADQRGSYASERGQHALAISHLENAMRLRPPPQDNRWVRQTELGLAYSYAEQGRFGDAEHFLADAALRDSSHEFEPVRVWVAARIAYRRHDLATAASLVEKYFQLPAVASADPDDRIDVAILGAQVELERGDLDRVRHWAQRGIGQVELVRGAQSVLELRPWVLDKRRAPYELLFVAQARSHEFEEAALIFDRWQGRTVQDALVRSQPPASLDYRDMADHFTKLGEWLRVASQAPFAGSPDRDAVLRAMRDIDLVALIVANDDVWRLTANHGMPRLTQLGSFVEIKKLVDKFRGRPTDVQAASDLAARLLPDDVFQPTQESLHVVVDGRLPPLPVAALRRNGVPLVALRPIVRALRLPETRCAHVMRSGHATVLAYPSDNLPGTLAEAAQVAPLLRATTELGASATKAALLSAAHDAVLHVAAHGNVGMDGAALVLAGGEISALEISARRIAPSLVMLSACSGGVSDDPELAGSLVAGFFGAGSQHVVATLGGIFDAGASEIVTRFYLAGGVADPVRALRTAQSALAKTNNIDWPYFAVFGPDVCPEDASRRR